MIHPKARNAVAEIGVVSIGCKCVVWIELEHVHECTTRTCTCTRTVLKLCTVLTTVHAVVLWLLVVSRALHTLRNPLVRWKQKCATVQYNSIKFVTIMYVENQYSTVL